MVEEDEENQGYLTYEKILLTELLLFINRNMEKFDEQQDIMQPTKQNV